MSAFTFKCGTFCIAAAVRVVTIYINGGGGTFAVLVVGAVVGFAVDVDGFTAAAGVYGICGRSFVLTAKTLTGSIVCIACLGAFYIDGTFGTEGIPVVAAVMGGTFQKCHIVFPPYKIL